MVLTAAVVLGFILVAWQIDRLTRAIGQSMLLMSRASDMAHDNAHNLLDAILSLQDDLRAPRCEVQGCPEFAELKIIDHDLDRTHYVCHKHDHWGEQPTNSMIRRTSLPSRYDLFNEARSALSRYRNPNG